MAPPGISHRPESAQALEIDLAAMQIVRSISLSDVLIPSAEITFLAQMAFAIRKPIRHVGLRARAQTTIASR